MRTPERRGGDAGWGLVNETRDHLEKIGFGSEGENTPSVSKVGTSEDAREEIEARKDYKKRKSKARTRENMGRLQRAAKVAGVLGAARDDSKDRIVKGWREANMYQPEKKDSRLVSKMVDRGWNKPK